MNSDYRKFFRGCYLNTNGFIPTKPLNQCVFPGDFFQIRNGEMIVLGNIFRNGVIDPADVQFGSGIRQTQAGWHFGEGVTKPYSGRGHGKGAIEGDFEFSTQRLAFENPGSYFFKGNNPESLKISNWNQVQQSCIVKLTQTLFSFRELYVITETATTENWTLAVSGSNDAELEIATETENFGLVDIFGLHTTKIIQSRGMEYYHREGVRKPSFYRAKKLVVQDEKLQTFISELIEERTHQYEWASGFFNYENSGEVYSGVHVPSVAQASVLDMLQANELNPNSALLYFKWIDANLDDVEKFFAGYGNQ